jgi:hypothetical protein
MRYILKREDGVELTTTHRVRAELFAEQAADARVPYEWRETSPRFRIKIAKHPTLTPFKLNDRTQPAFVRGYATLDAATRAMDNIVRRERGLAPRIEWPNNDAREAMKMPASWHEYRDHAARYGIEA